MREGSRPVGLGSYHSPGPHELCLLRPQTPPPRSPLTAPTEGTRHVPCPPPPPGKGGLLGAESPVRILANTTFFLLLFASVHMHGGGGWGGGSGFTPLHTLCRVEGTTGTAVGMIDEL